MRIESIIDYLYNFYELYEGKKSWSSIGSEGHYLIMFNLNEYDFKVKIEKKEVIK